jgi:preprotein translocase subunit SecG
MGTAFGGGATDALFGAGTGNALTNLTKYCTITFFVLTLGLSVLNARHTSAKRSQLGQALEALQAEDLTNALPAVTPPASATNPPEASQPAGTPAPDVSNNPLNTVIPLESAPPAPVTPPPAAKPADIPNPAPGAPSPDKN